MMKNKLVENMRRFGTKNLSEQSTKPFEWNDVDLKNKFETARSILAKNTNYEKTGEYFKGPFPDPRLIAFGLYHAKGYLAIHNDKEAWAQDAMAMIPNKETYDKVSKILGTDALKWIKSFMHGDSIMTDYHGNGKIPDIRSSYNRIMGGY